ncbi:type II secretion system protein GspL [Chitinolyticbacter albus]|uniref:type II secretion system protein GspL n=1 Tax=Chitinolyticbacter albus TaxID=2961951 RepID=UPI00210B9BC6|nr:type II secretion system protein GspL [Chitinolyticbacter albus]
MSASAPHPTLRILLDGQPTETTELAWFAPTGSALDSGRGPVAALPAVAHLVLLLPPTRLSLHLVTLPKQPPAKLRALLPMALEDRLLAPPSKLWFGLHPLGDGLWQVQVVERDWLSGWLNLLRGHGHTVDAAYALADLIADDLSGWQQVDLPGTSQLLKSPTGEVISLDDAAIGAALTSGSTVTPLPLEAVCERPLPPRNLLQAEFSPRPAWQPDWKPWRRPAVLLAVLLLLLTALNIGEWWQLSRRADALKREMRQTFAAALPGVPVVDPVLQLQSRLREAGVNEGTAGGNTLQDTLRRIDQAGGALQLDALRYADGTLELVVKGDAAATRAQLNAAGLPFEQVQGNEGRALLRLQAPQ